jgi:hypothetical protein
MPTFNAIKKGLLWGPNMTITTQDKKLQFRPIEINKKHK